MKRLFADTWYWVALIHDRDAAHERAKAIRQGLQNVILVTKQEVLIEVLNHFSSRLGKHWRQGAIAAVREILNSPAVEVIAQSYGSFSAGLELFEDRPDKGYSMTDCISMKTMRARRIRQVLSSDRHFEQEGSQILR